MTTLTEIRTAQEKLPAEIVRTPLLFAKDLSEQFRCQLYLQTDNLQVAGSYKSRSAFTLLNNLST